jgi:hypothetical protein
LFKSGTGVEVDTGFLADERLDLLEEEEIEAENVFSVIVPEDLDWLNVDEFLIMREFRWNQLRFAETSDLRATAIIFLDIYFVLENEDKGDKEEFFLPYLYPDPRSLARARDCLESVFLVQSRGL